MDRAARRMLDLLYPAKALCVACGDRSGQAWDWLCESCAEQLDEERSGSFHVNGLDDAYAPYRYEGPVVSIVHALKYTGYKQLARPMALEMLEGLAQTGPDEDILVTAVPMHPRRERQRGYNQAALLARALAVEAKLPFEMVLSRVRNTPQQAKLDHEERAKNLKGAFVAEGRLDGRTIVLVDDVSTTGSTARACAKELYKAGAARVALICYAQA